MNRAHGRGTEPQSRVGVVVMRSNQGGFSGNQMPKDCKEVKGWRRTSRGRWAAVEAGGTGAGVGRTDEVAAWLGQTQGDQCILV